MKIALVAGEASGDLLGAELLAGLRRRFPELEALGVGGPRMARQGVKSLFPMETLSIIGLVEAVRRLPSVWRAFRQVARMLETQRPDLLVTIDLPDFNFRLAATAKKFNIPVVHYVSPQVWAWRAGRVHQVARRVDHLLALFPFEPPYYAGTGLPVTFVGHPLVQTARPDHPPEAVRRELGLVPGERLLTLLPGSRRGELERLTPVMAQTCALLRRQRPELRFALALAETLTEVEARRIWAETPDAPPVILLQGRTYDLVSAAEVVVAASGTATLEVALLGTPMVVVYRVNALTYAIGRRVIRVPWISLVNVTAGQGIVPERIQEACEPLTLSRDVIQLLDDPEARQRQKEGFDLVRRQLGAPQEEACDVVARFLLKKGS
ncbi:MAG: lipid-A-disaccharide synthase [Magnetococcales bacterium]|nr:lipid-A-disaccharide synthase [Magnetococcales bacterium]